MIFLIINDALLFQSGKLAGERGPLGIQKIGQLLAVKGNIKIRRMLPYGFGGKIGQNLIAQAMLRNIRQLFVQHEIFFARSRTR